MLNFNIDLKGKTVLVTGAAGCIGCNLSLKLLREHEGIKVIGFDSVNDYYNVRIKEERLGWLAAYPGFTFVKGNLADKALCDQLFAEH